jgi:hypothetical protein
MEVMRSSETPVSVRTTLRCISEDGNIRNYRCENLKSYNFQLFLSSSSFAICWHETAYIQFDHAKVNAVCVLIAALSLT